MSNKNEAGTQDKLHNTLQKKKYVYSKLSWDDVILIQTLWVLLYLAIDSSCTEVNKFCVTEYATVWSSLIIDTFRQVEELEAEVTEVKSTAKETFIAAMANFNFLTQLSIPTHAQLQCHRLKLIKNHLKTPTCFGLRPSSGSYNVLAKITIIWPQLDVC